MIFRNVTFTSRIEIFKLWLELFFHQVVSMGGRPSPALEREAVENGGKCEVIIDFNWHLAAWFFFGFFRFCQCFVS